MTTEQPIDHTWVHDRLATALTGGLSPGEQTQFDSHIHSCADCFDAFTEARDADRGMLRALSTLAPGSDFEQELVTGFREKEMKSRLRPLVKRSGFAVAAALAFAATGVFAQYVVQSDVLNNPLSKKLAMQGVPASLELGNTVRSVMPTFAFGTKSLPAVLETPLKDLSGSYPDLLEKNSEVRDGSAIRLRVDPKTMPAEEKAVRELGQALSDRIPLGTRRNEPTVIYGNQQDSVSQSLKFGIESGKDLITPVQNEPNVKLYFVPSGDVAGGGEVHALEKAADQLSLMGSNAYRGQVAQGKVVAELPGLANPPGSTPPTTHPTQVSAAVDVAERKVIRNGEVEFEVRSFEDAYATISSVVGEEGGFVSATNSEKLANGKVRGSIVVRVPPEHLDRMLLKLRALGELKSQQISANDVTKQYTDLDSELRALRAMESRLIDIIKTANGEVKDLVVAEKQLGEYRVRIEKIEGEMRYYNNLISMATLTVTAYEKDIQTPTAAQEQENVSMSIEAEDVEAKYADARKIIEDAKGRIVDSELKKHDADQFAAQIVADVPPDKADFVASQLKQIGKIAGFNRDRKQTTTGGSGAPNVQVEQKPTRFTLSLYNLANIAPRETTVLTIAVHDVEGSFNSILSMVRKQDGARPSGRVVTSNLNGQQPDQMTADIRADVTAADADSIVGSIRQLGEVMNSTLSENPDTANVTSAKRGLQLRLVNTNAVAARESRVSSMVAIQVPEAYGKLLTSLQTLEAAGNAHLLASQLNQSDPRTVNATLAFDVRRESLPAVEKALAEAGIDTLSQNIVRSTDTASTLDSKVHFQIDELKSADALAPRRTTTLGLETENVEKSMDMLRTELEKDGVKHSDYSLSKEASGRVVGHLVMDVPVVNAMKVLGHIRDMGGTERVNQVVDNPQVPETRFARERIDLTLASREAIVGEDRGLATTMRAALASAAAALLWSVYLIVTGVLFVGPWIAIAWIGWRVLRRKKAPVT